ncbi:vascular endothelial growth factor receptor 1-like [Paramacrobiotus metropolitanus]|uniref:vascular endothelial growth factor receptor 1-like n=1 Tax=Paramacrobiotus metropolitanus TaxID=2943436 RepID=UPI002445B966|nr:vascular endothelial growth factor receptor 1-like [Paramacrobiotus metropolitanus]
MYISYSYDLRGFILINFAILSLSLWPPVAAFPVNITDTTDPLLERYCNQEPLIIENDRYGGSFMLFNYPEQSCSVVVTIVAPPAINGTCSVYINIVESTMPEDDEMKVYQHVANGSGSLLKVIRHDVDNSATSVGQFRTANFHRNVTLMLNLTRHAKPVDKSHQIKFQYTLVIDEPTGNDTTAWTRCRALKGYVSRQLACEGQWKDRFTCPTELKAATNGNNPAKYHDERACTDVSSTEPHRDDFNDNQTWLSAWNVRNRVKKGKGYTEYTGQQNVWVSEGSLHMQARTKVDSASHTTYDVSHLSSGTHYNFTYGEVEFRAKLPDDPKMSVVTMLRLIDAECLFDKSPACPPSEPCPCRDQAISVADLRNVEPNRVDVGVNYGVDKEKAWIHTGQSSLLDGQFHTFKVRWSRDSMYWYVDDVEIRRLTEVVMIPSAPMQILIELVIFPQAQPVDAEAELLVDYIAVRKLNAPNSTTPIIGVGASTSSSEDVQWKMWVALAAVVALVFTLFGVWYWRRRYPPVNPMRPAYSPDAFFEVIREVDDEVDDARKKHIKELYIAWKIPPLAAGLKIPRTSLKFEKKLDEGEFGEVWKGLAYDLSEWPSPSVVAVKCVKNSADDYQHKLLMDEVTVHSKAGRHLNIVNLLGITLSGQLHIILEFSPHGSLLKYLRLHGKLFEGKTDETNYLNEGMVNFSIAGREPNVPQEWPLKTEDLINFTYQISRGMEYLALHNIIHRDLAARNILVCDNKVLKICDFGLAKQKADYYRMAESQNAKVPARWMAPESLEQRMFSERSDVWSFGIVMWEIFSYGEIPYHDTIKNLSYEDITAALRKGLRLKIPSKCPEEMFEIMSGCWEYEAEKRPSFSALSQKVEPHVGKDAQCEYMDLNKQYVVFNMKHAEDYIAVDSSDSQ